MVAAVAGGGVAGCEPHAERMHAEIRMMFFSFMRRRTSIEQDVLALFYGFPHAAVSDGNNINS
jgi:hypothetical protein